MGRAAAPLPQRRGRPRSSPTVAEARRRQWEETLVTARRSWLGLLHPVPHAARLTQPSSGGAAPRGVKVPCSDDLLIKYIFLVLSYAFSTGK